MGRRADVHYLISSQTRFALWSAGMKMLVQHGSSGHDGSWRRLNGPAHRRRGPTGRPTIGQVQMNSLHSRRSGMMPKQ
jgi:hypothetical protein